MAEALVPDGSLIESTGVAHQEHGPIWYGSQERPKFIPRQGRANRPLVDQIHDLVKEIFVPAVVANKRAHGAWLHHAGPKIALKCATQSLVPSSEDRLSLLV